MRIGALLLLGIALGLPAQAQVLPSGDNDPKMVTCIRGEKRTGSSGPPVCKTNAEWALLNQQRIDPAAIGNPSFCVGPEGSVDKGSGQACR